MPQRTILKRDAIRRTNSDPTQVRYRFGRHFYLHAGKNSACLLKTFSLFFYIIP